MPEQRMQTGDEEHNIIVTKILARVTDAAFERCLGIVCKHRRTFGRYKANLSLLAGGSRPDFWFPATVLAACPKSVNKE
jgi:hypothetical protein